MGPSECRGPVFGDGLDACVKKFLTRVIVAINSDDSHINLSSWVQPIKSRPSKVIGSSCYSSGLWAKINSESR